MADCFAIIAKALENYTDIVLGKEALIKLTYLEDVIVMREGAAELDSLHSLKMWLDLFQMIDSCIHTVMAEEFHRMAAANSSNTSYPRPVVDICELSLIIIAHLKNLATIWTQEEYKIWKSYATYENIAQLVIQTHAVTPSIGKTKSVQFSATTGYSLLYLFMSDYKTMQPANLQGFDYYLADMLGHAFKPDLQHDGSLSDAAYLRSLLKREISQPDFVVRYDIVLSRACYGVILKAISFHDLTHRKIYSRLLQVSALHPPLAAVLEGKMHILSQLEVNEILHLLPYLSFTAINAYITKYIANKRAASDDNSWLSKIGIVFTALIQRNDGSNKKNEGSTHVVKELMFKYPYLYKCLCESKAGSLATIYAICNPDMTQQYLQYRYPEVEINSSSMRTLADDQEFYESIILLSHLHVPIQGNSIPIRSWIKKSFTSDSDQLFQALAAYWLILRRQQQFASSSLALTESWFTKQIAESLVSRILRVLQKDDEDIEILATMPTQNQAQDPNLPGSYLTLFSEIIAVLTRDANLTFNIVCLEPIIACAAADGDVQLMTPILRLMQAAISEVNPMLLTNKARVEIINKFELVTGFVQSLPKSVPMSLLSSFARGVLANLKIGTTDEIDCLADVYASIISEYRGAEGIQQTILRLAFLLLLDALTNICKRPYDFAHGAEVLLPGLLAHFSARSNNIFPARSAEYIARAVVEEEGITDTEYRATLSKAVTLHMFGLLITVAPQSANIRHRLSDVDLRLIFCKTSEESAQLSDAMAALLAAPRKKRRVEFTPPPSAETATLIVERTVFRESCTTVAEDLDMPSMTIDDSGDIDPSDPAEEAVLFLKSHRRDLCQFHRQLDLSKILLRAESCNAIERLRSNDEFLKMLSSGVQTLVASLATCNPHIELIRIVVWRFPMTLGTSIRARLSNFYSILAKIGICKVITTQTQPARVGEGEVLDSAVDALFYDLNVKAISDFCSKAYMAEITTGLLSGESNSMHYMMLDYLVSIAKFVHFSAAKANFVSPLFFEPAAPYDKWLADEGGLLDSPLISHVLPHKFEPVECQRSRAAIVRNLLNSGYFDALVTAVGLEDDTLNREATEGLLYWSRTGMTEILRCKHDYLIALRKQTAASMNRDSLRGRQLRMLDTKVKPRYPPSEYIQILCLTSALHAETKSPKVLALPLFSARILFFALQNRELSALLYRTKPIIDDGGMISKWVYSLLMKFATKHWNNARFSSVIAYSSSSSQNLTIQLSALKHALCAAKNPY